MSFEYNIDLNYKIYDKNILYIKIIDDENYFDIVFNDKKQLMNIPYKISKSSSMNDVKFTIDAPDLKVQEEKKEEIDTSKIEEKKEEIKKEEIQEEIVKQTILDKFVLNIKKNLLVIKNGEDKTELLFLLMASFIYGVINFFI